MNEQVAGLYAEIGLKITNALRGLRDFRSRLRNAQGSLKTLRDQSKITQNALSVGLTAGFVAMGAKAVGAFGDAQASMNVFALVTKATTGEMEAARAKIAELARDASLPGATIPASSAALAELGKAGLSARDAIAALRPTMLLAAAGGLEAGEAAQILANALNAFKLPGTEASRIADLLAAAEVVAAGSIRDHAAALAQAMAVYAQAKVPIEDLVTQIALLANQGIIGADAGTSLRSMMLRLIAPTEEAAGMMRAMGISIYDAQGRMRPFREIIEQFERGLKPLTDAQKNQRLETIFGSDAIRAAAIIFGGGIKAYDEMKDAVTRAGTAQELATAKTSGLSGSTENLSKTIQNASTNAVKPFEEDIKVITGALVRAIEAFDSLDDGTKKMVIGLVGLVVAVAAVAGGVAIAASAISGMITGVATAWGWIVALGAVVETLGVALGAVALGPLGLVILALGGLVAVLVWAYNESETFRRVVDAAFAGVRDVARELERGVDDLGGAFRDLTGIRVDFGAIFQGIPIVREIMAIWEQVKRFGWVGGGGSVGGGFGNPPVTVGGGVTPGSSGSGHSVTIRDAGGPGQAGRAYGIGVPELFVPRSSGSFVPLGGASVGGSVNVNFYGQVFGFSDVKDMIVRAIDEATREGRITNA